MKLATTAPTRDEKLDFIGWGRTKTEWVPQTPKTGSFTIDTIDPKELTITGYNPADTSLCLGDSGAPGLRTTPNGQELTALNSRSWQKNCIGTPNTTTNNTAYATRLDDITPWIQNVINNGKKLDVENNQIVRINPAGDKNTCVSYLARARTANDTAFTNACDPKNEIPQRFEMVEQGNPSQGNTVYMLRDWVSRQCLTNTNGKYVIQAKCDDTSAAQKWDITPAAKNSRNIKNVENGKVLDVVGVNLVQADLNTESATQRWSITKESKAIPAQALSQLNNFVSLQTSNITPARSAIHTNADLADTAAITQNSSEAERKASSWKVVPGLADNTCVSLQSVDYTWAYLGMDISSKRVGVVDKNQAANATWCLRTGTDANTVTLDAMKNPNLSLRHSEGKLWIGSKAGTENGDGPNTVLFDQDSSWKIDLPWSTNQGGSGTNEAAWAINQRAQQMNFGNPSGDLVCGLKNNGCYQAFGNGKFVIWSPNTGAWPSQGGIRDIYKRNNFENGPLGYPTSNEVCGLRSNGCYQNYQGGAIYWGPGEGVGAILNNDILNKYRELGAQDSVSGYPTEDTKCGLKNSGCRQVFKGGYIATSPGTGTHPVFGAIGGAWKDGGFETGRLGYPTSGEIPTSTGSYQTFEGGTATWTNSPAKLEITYK
ncbi:MAG: AbfB domain-containing protein [Renibacterium salmoninarum]|nr:AbfB domain-containing protein [Renibacterium salmoninarum]